VLGWLLLCGCRSGGAGQLRQSLDSASNACRTNPAYCASLPGGVRAGAQAGASVAGAVKVLDTAGRLRIRKLIEECADIANNEVNLLHFGDRPPTPQQCQEQVGTDAEGKPRTRAMQLGQEKHVVALECVLQRLSLERPGGFSLEQRYRYDPATGALELISHAEAQALLRSGQAAQLKGTLIPDVVIHMGNPLLAEDVFDLKFPCPTGKTPQWGQYPPRHPYANRTQGDMYEQALKVRPWLVSPILGAAQ
jgi:hypothetical protein